MEEGAIQQFQANPLISKVLMFKTNNEESNAKVAALRSIIKLSQNSNPNYIQSKQTTCRGDSKEPPASQAQQQLNGAQFKQIAQKIKIIEGQGQFVSKCASANQTQKQAILQQAQYMQRITSSRMNAGQNMNYHNQLKQGKESDKSCTVLSEKYENQQQNHSNAKISMSQHCNNNLNISEKENSSSIKLQNGQPVNIRNIKINNSHSSKIQEHPGEANVQIPLFQAHKTQQVHQQKMHQILLNTQSKNAQIATTARQISRNLMHGGVVSQQEISVISGSSTQQQTNTAQNESFKQEQKERNDQLSRKNSILSNGSTATQNRAQVYSQINQQCSPTTEEKTDYASQQKMQKLTTEQRNQNTTQITFTNAESAQRSQRQKIPDTLPAKVDKLAYANYSQKKCQGSEDRNRGKKLNFYNFDQMSPNSETLSQLKATRLANAIKHIADDDFCGEDESIVIIQEDQLRIPMRSSKKSQECYQEVIQETKEDLTISTEKSVFLKKHDTSVIEQESLVTQIKSQLMKIQFQQTFQNEAGNKRARNGRKKEFQTIKNGFASELDEDSQIVQTSGTFYCEPQFEDISFELDTCNQVRIPRNLGQPINEVNILQVPFELDVYQEKRCPITGKIMFQIDAKAITIVNNRLKTNMIHKPEVQILQSQVLEFKDPLKGKLKRDYETKAEEKQEEEAIAKGILLTEQIIDQSLSLRTSLCNSSNNQSLNTLISDDVSINSILMQQAFLGGQGSNIQTVNGILSYASDKLNIREGECLFLLPRLKSELGLKPALFQRDPEWWYGFDSNTGTGKRKHDFEPILETFLF